MAGVDVLRYNWTEGCDWLELPLVTFDGETTGNGGSDFLTGSIDNFTQGAGEYNQTRQTSWVPYVQDTVRLKPNLTLNAGVRWEPYFPASVTGGRIPVFPPGEQSTKYPNAPVGLVFPGDAGISDTGGVPSSVGEFSPRIGIAWQPRALPRTSIRAAFGIFIAPFENTYYHHEADTAPYSPTYTLTYVQNGVINLTNPWASSAGTGYADPFPPFSNLSYVPPTNTQFYLPVGVEDGFAPGFTLGKDQSWNLSIQHQFTPNTMLSVAYVGSETYHLPILIDRNPGIFAAGGQRTEYPDFNSIYENASWGTSSYNGLQISFEKRFSHGLQFTSNYTWSKTLDWASAASTAFNGPVGDPFDLKWNYGISDMNFPQMWVTNFLYQTPTLRNHSRPLRVVLGNWKPTGIFTMESGAPFSISGGCKGSDNSLSLIGGDRADLTGQPIQVRQGSEGHWLQQYFNPAAFEYNAPGTFGDSARNFIAGPPLVNMDLGIDKDFPFKERYKVEFRWEMFNAFNTPHFGSPGTNPAGWGFGQITGEASPPRIMQAVLKFYW